ncbi:hypothetical protein JL720_14758 [Aureococcus anophagefferens]|nr:hypothetical protein JL720_14758 [Aureococcus anophagefferens]
MPLACSEAVATLIDGSRHAQSLTAARADRGPPEFAAVARMMRIALVALAAALAAPPDDDAAAPPDGDAAGVDWQRRRVVRVFASPFAGSNEAPAYAMTDALGRGYTCGLDGAAVAAAGAALAPSAALQAAKLPRRRRRAGASHALGAFSSAAGEASLEEVADVFGDVASRTARVASPLACAPRDLRTAVAAQAAAKLEGKCLRRRWRGDWWTYGLRRRRRAPVPPAARRDHDGFGVLPAADAAASRDPGGFAIGAFSHVAVAPATGALSHVFTGGDAAA